MTNNHDPNADTMTSPFQCLTPAVIGNDKLRIPQQGAYVEVTAHYAGADPEREVGMILPVGCGKSGVITLLPFALKARRVLVVAPSVKIAEQLFDNFNPPHPDFFYEKAGVLTASPYPEPVDVRGGKTNVGDFEEADVVVTNIHQLLGAENQWLTALPPDFFDLIMFDEGHHSVAASWETLRKKFPEARIVNLSATPLRADGQLMAGKVIYSFPVAEGIRLGYIKHLKGLVLNPSTLRYVRREDGQEIDVSLEEVRRLGEEDADFRRSIVTSTATLNTIVDASLRELSRLREETGERRLAIIASALNYEHCLQIVEAYRARGQRAAFVHSKEDGPANDKVYKQLKNDELDVIVQVRKLGEGFDHKFLSVAAVFSVFANLSPFIQFVGRIMRAIDQNDPQSLKNRGTVVFHAGSNLAGQWSDFQNFSQADQAYFEQLLPLTGLDFTDADEISVTPGFRPENTVEIRTQGGVSLEEIPLLKDLQLRSAFEMLVRNGMTPDDFRTAYDLRPVPTTKVAARRAKRSALNDELGRRAGKLLKERKINPEGHELDTRHLDQSNFVVVMAALNKKVNALVGRKERQRGEFTRQELDRAEAGLDAMEQAVVKEIWNG